MSSSCSQPAPVKAGAGEGAELSQKGSDQLAVVGAAAEQPGEPWRAEYRPLGSCRATPTILRASRTRCAQLV
jgi:hypothetical protein